MTVIGCAGVGTTDQDVSIQEAAFHAAGCDVLGFDRHADVGPRHFTNAPDFGDEVVTRLGTAASRAPWDS